MIEIAYYSSSVRSFIAESPQSVIGVLAKHHQHDLDVLQRNSWIAQIDLLQRELAELEGGWIAFEFAIPRMGKRVDNIEARRWYGFQVLAGFPPGMRTASGTDQR